ncbi:hypothetical protein [Gilvimarinus chinensis]|uniref:hypothetical protein n=1 Tax=Gilvimarinus chinensis TaxID=396005 RepID=UPI0003627AE6|nr:hypothetical protein [Gilvimarinus chinensis]
MHLVDIVNNHASAAKSGVPDWMLGYFKRRSISFSNGETDTKTHVCWLQSRNFTIDLRLPIESEQVVNKPLQEYSAAELRTLGNYEGWVADSVWNGETLAWENEIALQLHGRWQEPAYLKRVGNCMMEFCPSDAYVEDWRLQPSAPGPLIGLRLLQEKNLSTQTITRNSGGLIICGDYAALVLGRPEPIMADSANALREKAQSAVGDKAALSQLFDFETSVAKGSMQNGFAVSLSTCPERIGKEIFSLDGFSISPDSKTLTQNFAATDGSVVERVYAIDTIESGVEFTQTTPTCEPSKQWFDRESETLCRYTQPCY